MLEVVESLAIWSFVIGSFYLLVSIGFSILCGVLRIWHIGYSYMFTLTAYITYMLMVDFGLPIIPAAIGAVIFQFIFAILVYRFLMVRYLDEEPMLLASLLLLALMISAWANFQYPPYLGVSLPTEILHGTVKIGIFEFPKQMLLVAIIGLFISFAYILFFLKTRTGLCMRATTMDLDTAKLMGLKIRRNYLIASIISVIPPTVATFIVSPIWGVNPNMGFDYFHFAVIVSILGSMGNLKGTIVSSYILGFINSFVSSVIGEPRLTTLAGFLFAWVVMIFRKEGLFRSETIW
jgi:branched-chain amino acid transport system permease protein